MAAVSGHGGRKPVLDITSKRRLVSSPPAGDGADTAAGGNYVLLRRSGLIGITASTSAIRQAVNPGGYPASCAF